MPYYHHQERESSRARENEYRRIEWMRSAKRWFKKGMIVIIAFLIVAILLSYVFITQEEEPQDIEVHKTLLERI